MSYGSFYASFCCSLAASGLCACVLHGTLMLLVLDADCFDLPSITKSNTPASSGSAHHWFSGIIPRCHRGDPGSIPGWCTVQPSLCIENIAAEVANSGCLWGCSAVVARPLCKRKAVGSNPTSSKLLLYFALACEYI